VGLAHTPNVFHEDLGVSVGDVEANKGDLRHLVQDAAQLVEIVVIRAARYAHKGKRGSVARGEFLPLQVSIIISISIANYTSS
jgi:hypothetical protein